MRPYHRSSRLIAIVTGPLAVVSARPAMGEVHGIVPAQDTARMILNFSTFAGETGAKQAMDAEVQPGP
jgi:hypothetical protein